MADDKTATVCDYCKMPLEDIAQFHTIEYCYVFRHRAKSRTGSVVELAEQVNIGMEFLAATHPRTTNILARLAEAEEKNKRLAEALENCRLAAIRNHSPEWTHVLRFCKQAGVGGDIVRRGEF